MSKSLFRTGVALSAMWISASAVQASGWYHMPTSYCQCMGWGFGPGYHAPLLLGPRRCGPTMPYRVVHLPAAPFGVGVGCGGCEECGMSQLTSPQFLPAAYGGLDPGQPPIETPPAAYPPTPSTPPPTIPRFGPPPSPARGR